MIKVCKENSGELVFGTIWEGPNLALPKMTPGSDLGLLSHLGEIWDS